MADPESALRPRAARKDAKETQEVNKAEEANGTKESTKVTGPVGSKTAAEPVEGDEPKRAAEPETVSAATVTATMKTSSGDASSEAASSSAKRSDEHREGDVGSLVAAAGGNPPGSTSESDGGEGGDKPPSGRPTKALLAAAGIGGALLIAIPFLVAGTNNSKDDSEPAALARKASAHTMPANDEDKAPGVYAPKSPDRPKPTPEDKSKAPKSPAAKPSPSVTEKQKEEKKPAPAPKKSKKASPKRAMALIDYSNKKNVLLRNAVTGRCADIPGYGKGEVDGKIQQYYCDGTSADNQLWNFEVRYKDKGPASANLFQIRNVKDGLCMDLPYYGGAEHGDEVTEYHCDGTTKDNQLWWLEQRGSKTWWIHNYASNQMCLAIKADRGSTDPSAKLAIGPCRSDRNHEWII
ncbi:RICIN domain-containing protein [Streptomyces sp. NBRC 110028]|uniref:RICIN domain-containing protein n=1 Tax=Streptomyces sp. NBRC 110028 TaxID=1621260 RepID=UPI00131E7DB2|nr:RICIN domain-containing protein [Streptomyces sp. NBRC 110028]